MTRYAYQAELRANGSGRACWTRVALAGTGAAHGARQACEGVCRPGDEKVARLQELGAPLRVPVHHQHFLSVQAVAGPPYPAFDARLAIKQGLARRGPSPADDPADTAIGLCDSGATLYPPL